MIRVTYKTERYDTKINSVEYCEECPCEDNYDSDVDIETGDRKKKSEEETCCGTELSRNEKIFCVDKKSDYVYLLVCTIDDGCCCMSGSTERVTHVSNNFKQIINILMKYVNKTTPYDSIDYDVRSYILVDDTRYVYAQTYAINQSNCECDDGKYIFIWLYNGNKKIPFPDETQEHFENKLTKYESVRTRSEEYHKKLNDICNKITAELSSQIQYEKQMKTDLLQKLNKLCDIDELGFGCAYKLDNAPTTTEKILNNRIAEIRVRKDLKTLQY